MGGSGFGRAACAAWIVGGALLAAGCGTSVEAADRDTTTVSESTSTVEREPDAHLLQFREALAAEDLVADVSDDTLLAVVRGVCDRLAGGATEEEVVALVRPVAAYAAAAADAAVRGDDAAHRYVVVARDTYC